MEQTPNAQAGTLESNDIFIRLTKAAEGAEGSISLESIVMQQFGDDILKTIRQSLADAGLTGVDVHANDRGALTCTIMARVEAAAARYKEMLS